jgi:hypothetical protein
VDPETVDQNYAQLQQQAQQTAAQIQTLASKLQAAAVAGDPNAREWMLDPVACCSSSSAADSVVRS